VISEEIGSQKPDPAFFTALFTITGMEGEDRKRALVIGDSLSSDIKGAIGAKLDSCWYNPDRTNADPQQRPTYQIASLDELLELLPKEAVTS